MGQQERAWVLFEQNREEVVAALREGRCDGILPATTTFFDNFAGFLQQSQLLPLFDSFPDRRERRSIVPFFFCHTMLYRPLFRISRLAQIGDTLFRSPYILRLLGFNARQIQTGFYEGDGEKPFDPEALGEFFALTTDEEFFAHQIEWLKGLLRAWPETFRQGLWVMDGFRFAVAKGGHGVPAGDYKGCVLGVWQDGEVWPMLWRFADGTAHDLPLGKEVLSAAQTALGEGVIRHLLVDAGFIDGEWLAELSASMTATIRVREDMDLFSDLQGLARRAPEKWEAVALPRRPKSKETPLRRDILGFSELTSWSSCSAPLSGCLVRDTYAAKVAYWAIARTRDGADARTIYSAYRKRWDLEETFMAATRYWRMEDLPPARRGVILAMVHFALLAFTLLGLYLAVSALDKRPWSPPPQMLPEREFAVYVGPYYTLLRGSELMAVVLEHLDVWSQNKEKILSALQMTEGSKLNC